MQLTECMSHDLQTYDHSMILTVFLVVVAIVFKLALCLFYDVNLTRYPDGEPSHCEGSQNDRAARFLF